MTIYIDFDGVIYDTVSLIINEIKKNSISLDKDCNLFFENLDWKKILYSADEINFAKTKINSLKRKYNVKILSHISSINEMLEKFDFIRKQNLDIDVIFVPKKIDKNSIIDPVNNILVDDSEKNVKKWIDSGGIGILFGNKGISDLSELENIIRGEINV